MAKPEYSIIIPFISDGAERAAHCEWLQAYYTAVLPEAEVIIGTYDHEAGTPLNRSRMRNCGVEAATTDLLALIDADCLLKAEQVREAVQLVRDGAAMVQFESVTWLTEEGTERVTKQKPTRFPRIADGDIKLANDKPLLGLAFILTRSAYLAAGGMDERMTGWGEEDPTFTVAVRAMVGEVVRVPYTAYHLYHGRTAEHSRHTREFIANQQLNARYRACRSSAELLPVIKANMHQRRRLRIAGLSTGYPPALRAGAEISLHALLKWLQRRGHAVTAITAEGIGGEYYDDIPVLAGNATMRRNWCREADIIIGKHGMAGEASLLASVMPAVAQVVNDLLTPEQRDRISRGASAVVANATATAQAWGTEHVLYPLVTAEEYQVDAPGECITLINLSENKGAPLFWELARMLPDRRFLAVRGAYDEQMILDDVPENVEVIGPVDDMREVYARTRVLLMPSAYESFGRCALEAACSGIPTIAHSTPGLSEALGDAGIYVDRDDIDGNMSAIMLLDDDEHYQTISEIARQRFAAYTAAMDAQLLAFEQLLLHLCAEILATGDSGIEEPVRWYRAVQTFPLRHQIIRRGQPIKLTAALADRLTARGLVSLMQERA